MVPKVLFPNFQRSFKFSHFLSNEFSWCFILIRSGPYTCKLLVVSLVFFFVSQLMHLKIIGHGLARQNFPTLKVPPHVCCKNYWVSWKVLSCSLSSILLVKYKCKLCFFPFQYLMYVSCCLIMEKICYVRSVRIL